MKARDLRFTITGDDNTQAAFASAEQRAQRFHSTMARGSRMAAQQQRNLVFQLNDVAVSLASGMNPMMVAMQQGSQIATIYGPGEGGIGRAFRETGKLITSAVAKFGPLIAAAGAAAGVFGGLAIEINRTSDVAVTMGDVFGAVMKLARDSVMNTLKPAFDFLAPHVVGIWDQIVQAAKGAGNTMTRMIVTAVETSIFAFQQFPNAVGASVIGAVNFVIRGVNAMISAATSSVNYLIDAINAQLQKLPETLRPALMGRIEGMQFGELKNQMFSGLVQGAESFDARMRVIATTDYMGNLYQQIRGTAIELARARNESEATSNAVKKAASDSVDAWGGLRQATQAANDNFRESESLFSNAGQAIAGLVNKSTTWLDVLGRIAIQLAQMAVSQIGGPWGALLSGFLGGLPGFATGGSFKVGGAGGVDSQLVAFRASPNETVNVTKPGQMVSGGHAVIELRMSPEVEARVLEKAGNQSIRIVQEAAPQIAMQGAAAAKADYARTGGQWGAR